MAYWLQANVRRNVLYNDWVIPGRLQGGALEVSELPDDPVFAQLRDNLSIVVLSQPPKETVADYRRAYADLEQEAVTEISKLKARIAELEAAAQP
jgi:hypothetical protein